MASIETGTEERHPLANLDRIIHSPVRLMVMTYLYVVESADFVFLMQLTGLTWGNLSTHLAKLEETGYVALEKGYKGKKPNTTVRLTEVGRNAFKAYKNGMKAVLNELPD